MKIKGAWQKRLFLTGGIMTAGVLLPTTILLCIGMLPTIIMLVFDRTSDKSRVMTIGAMNAAGCLPFVLELWHRGHTAEIALSYVTQPRTVVVMYLAAMIGYMIEWMMTTVVASIMVQKAKKRIEAVIESKQELERRWGIEVTGRYTLDEEGFISENSPKRG